mmetsp:Transcript_62967/g.172616  ORF Transcript_62967/g.172616 Transcript_62967/m.172616 type:complete len:289 (-) Transcript_62967:389-1255(-)
MRPCRCRTTTTGGPRRRRRRRRTRTWCRLPTPRRNYTSRRWARRRDGPWPTHARTQRTTRPLTRASWAMCKWRSSTMCYDGGFGGGCSRVFGSPSAPALLRHLLLAAAFNQLGKHGWSCLAPGAICARAVFACNTAPDLPQSGQGVAAYWFDILVVRYRGRATAPEFYIKTDKEGAARLLDLEALEREEEGAARWDAPGREPVGTVALVRRDLKQPHLADLHAEASLVPASNHATDTSLIRERLLPRVLGRPELLVGLLHHACRVDGHGVARLDLGCARMVVARGLRR